MTHKSEQGFTLIEILIALVVLGILVSVALPSYNSQVTRSRRADCMGVMLGFAQAMEKHRAVTFSYAEAAEDDADTGVPASTLHPAQCPVEGTAQYDLEIVSADASSFLLQATPDPDGPQAGDGALRINNLGQRFWDKNGDGEWADSENTWNSD